MPDLAALAPGETRVLVVETEDLPRRSLESLLRTNGYQVMVAGRTQEAQAALQWFQPHLVVVSLEPPPSGEGGLALLSEVKALLAGAESIALVPGRDLQRAEAALEAGACAFVWSPPGPELLISAIQRAANRVGLAAQNERLGSRLHAALQAVAAAQAELLILDEAQRGKLDVALATARRTVSGAFGPGDIADLSTLLVELKPLVAFARPADMARLAKRLETALEALQRLRAALVR
jgi:DNA-binding NtrC family response regulator